MPGFYGLEIELADRRRDDYVREVLEAYKSYKPSKSADIRGYNPPPSSRGVLLSLAKDEVKSPWWGRRWVVLFLLLLAALSYFFFPEFPEYAEIHRFVFGLSQ